MDKDSLQSNFIFPLEKWCSLGEHLREEVYKSPGSETGQKIGTGSVKD